MNQDDRDLDRERAVARRVGFAVYPDMVPPTLIWHHEGGALRKQRRPATEPEIRLWCMLIGRVYEPWSADHKIDEESLREARATVTPIRRGAGA